MAEEKRHENNIVEEPNTAHNSSIHFFISYNSTDKNWAEWIAWQLEEAGFTTILQAWDFRPGANFVIKMQEASEETERVIAVLSPDYLSSLYTQPEWAAAFKRDPKGNQGILVPVIVRECKEELIGMWTQIIHISLTGLDEPIARKTLLEGINLGRNKPITAPVFPGSIQHKEAEEPYFPGNSTDDTRSSDEMLEANGSKSNIQPLSSPNTVLVSSENILAPESTPSTNMSSQQLDTTKVQSYQPLQTTIESIPLSSSLLQPNNLNTPKEDVQKPVELPEQLNNYRRKLAKMEVTLDLGGSLTEDFARELQQLLYEIIATIRTISADKSPASHFNSRDGVLNNLRQAHNQLRLAFDALTPPFLLSSFLGSRKTEGFYQHLSNCRNFLEKALENW